MKIIIERTSDAGKDWKAKEKGVAVDEMLDRFIDSVDLNWANPGDSVGDRGVCVR